MLKEADESVPEEGTKTLVGDGVKFQRIRRITGYLVGVVDKFCNAKRKELNDRVLHAGKNFGQLPPKV